MGLWMGEYAWRNDAQMVRGVWWWRLGSGVYYLCRAGDFCVGFEGMASLSGLDQRRCSGGVSMFQRVGCIGLGIDMGCGIGWR